MANMGYHDIVRAMIDLGADIFIGRYDDEDIDNHDYCLL